MINIKVMECFCSRDVLHRQLTDPVFLPESNRFDAILTGCVIDIDFDGENEILVGTYGQVITNPHLMKICIVFRHVKLVI